VSLLVVRILRTGDDRLWFAVGAVAGLGLLAKETIVLLLLGLLVGFVVNRQVHMLRSPWLWAGVALAVVIWLPNILWEVHHGWPSIEMSRNLRREHSGAGYTATYPLIQILLAGWYVLPVWLAGLIALWRERRFRPYRSF